MDRVNFVICCWCWLMLLVSCCYVYITTDRYSWLICISLKIKQFWWRNDPFGWAHRNIYTICYGDTLFAVKKDKLYSSFDSPTVSFHFLTHVLRFQISSPISSSWPIVVERALTRLTFFFQNVRSLDDVTPLINHLIVDQWENGFVMQKQMATICVKTSSTAKEIASNSLKGKYRAT